MSFDYIKNTNLKILQDDNMFKMNTDTHLLGCYLTVKKNEVILDIGTNNGALLLYASLYSPKQMIGVDINEKALKLAEKNMEINNLECNLICCRIQDLKINNVDVIVCNPPYFVEKNKNIIEDIKNARHEDNLSLDELFMCYRRLLKDNGRIYMVHRANKIAQIIECGLKHDIKINKMKFVYDKRKKNAITVLLELRRGKTTLISVEDVKFI